MGLGRCGLGIPQLVRRKRLRRCGRPTGKEVECLLGRRRGLRGVDDELLTGVGWEIEGLVVEGEVADDGVVDLATVRSTLTWWVAQRPEGGLAVPDATGSASRRSVVVESMVDDNERGASM
jgi:hypothetical protein